MDLLVSLLLAGSAIFSVFAAVTALLARDASALVIEPRGRARNWSGPADEVERLLIEHQQRLDISTRELREATDAVRGLSRALISGQSAGLNISTELARLSGQLTDLASVGAGPIGSASELRRSHALGVEAPTAVPTHDIGLRELSHALGAPLVQIHSYATVLKRYIPPAGANSDPNDFDRYRTRIISGVRLCQALLTGYKRVEDMVKVQDGTIDDIDDAVTRLAGFFSIVGEDDDRSVVDGDLASSGYSSTLIIVLAAPLIENAVDEVGDAVSGVKFVVRRTKNELVIEVSNPTKSAASPEQIVAEGFTTKDGHDGIGLATVARIADAAGGRLIVEIVDGVFSANVHLPARPHGEMS